MKKLLLIAMLLSGCGYASLDNQRKIVIESISKSNNIYCRYYGDGNQLSFTFTDDEFCFIDTCGKFQIGDTINLIKLTK